jgi:glycine/D-amino acid oxidase-like deaminating enzyme
VIVGGGIIGCATACELAARGVDVLLLERAEIAHGASGRNHGLVYYPQNPVTDPLYKESLKSYRQIAESSPVRIELDDRPLGLVVLASNDDEWDLARTEAEICRVGGVPVERWDQSQLRSAEPEVADHFLGAWYIDDGYRLDPQALTTAFALEAIARGAEIRTHVDVKQLVVSNGAIKGVITDEGVVAAGAVVLAAGPWAPRLARTADVDIPISGARGWLLLVRPDRSVCNHLVESAGWHLVSGAPGPPDVTIGQYGSGDPPPTDVGLLLQPNPNGYLLVGGSRIVSLRQDAERPDIPQEIARRAAHTIPALADAPVSEVWSGVRPMSRDGMPLIGWVAEVEGLFVAGGHGGQGVMLGAGSGRLVAQIITGETAFTNSDPFRPDR